MRCTTAALVFLVCLAGGCDGFTFDEQKADAPVVVLDRPDGFALDGFGDAVAGFTAMRDGQPVSLLGVTGGRNAGFAVYRGWENGDMQLGNPRFDGCDEEGDCEVGTGAAIAGVPQWQGSSGDTEERCVLVTAPEAGALRVICETRLGFAERRTAPGGVRFGEAAVGLAAGDPAGVALIGAPGDGAGTVFRLPSGGSPIDDLALASGAMLASGAELGAALDAAPLSGGGTVVLAGAPGAQRVVVAHLDGSDAQVLGCFDGGTGFGADVALGDVDGNGELDAVVGHDLEADGRVPEAHVFALGDVTALLGGPMLGQGCTVDDPTDDPVSPTVHPCMDDVDEAVECADSGFGAAVDAGDLDADGTDEVLVGAPRARVEGERVAGAVYVVPTDGRDPRVLVDGRPAPDAALGRVLTTLPGHLGGSMQRDEVVAGAPGADEVLVFLCSGLTGDTPMIGDRCIASP